MIRGKTNRMGNKDEICKKHKHEQQNIAGLQLPTLHLGPLKLVKLHWISWFSWNVKWSKMCQCTVIHTIQAGLFNYCFESIIFDGYDYSKNQQETPLSTTAVLRSEHLAL